MSMDGETKIKDFTDLVTWQKSHRLVLSIYAIIKKFPDSERFALTSQMVRAAISITSNIAEGFGRNTAKDKIQFYSIAKGSVFELRSQMFIARDLGYIDGDTFEQFENDSQEVVRLIAGMMHSAQTRE